MSRHGVQPRRGVSWVHAVVAVPVAAIAWVVLTAVLTITLGDAALAGMIAIGVVAGVGCVLLLLPSSSAKGAGLGAIVTTVPCAIGLALTLM
ncbi:hypothetical protein [Janibacter anophelis]|uniref:hypothetical protein n=1 Tax=Janibacter anophelis TaxID=319054 RepID=UPI000DEEF671|nr:hypothetical protein [Janibacter anophelis]